MNRNGSQVHLLLNRVPVIGSLGSLLILLLAVIARREEYTRLALGLALLVALVTIPVLRSGEPAEKRIQHMPGVTEHWISQHEDMGKIAFGAMLLFGAVAALALGTARGGKSLARWVTPTALVLALVTSSLMAVTAHRGGMVRHTELRPGYVPAAEGPGGGTSASPGDSSSRGEREAGEEAEEKSETGEEHQPRCRRGARRGKIVLPNEKRAGDQCGTETASRAWACRPRSPRHPVVPAVHRC